MKYLIVSNFLFYLRKLY